jgi:eukaryotic-like serine/threonine-protein kinase
MDQHSAELLRDVQTGNPGAANVLFQRYAARLQALVRSRLAGLLSRRFDGDDVVQSALKSFFVRAGDGEFYVDQPGDLWRLLATITMRKLSRSSAYHQAAKRDARRDANFEVADFGLEQALAHDPMPAEAAAAAEEVLWIMKRVPVETRQALQLRLQGYEAQEIARQLNRSERTIRRWMDEVRGLMQDRLERFDNARSTKSKPPLNDVTMVESTGESITLLDPRDYLLNELIGAGGICKVYVATERSSGQKLCVKVLRREFRHKPRFVRRFLEEYRLGRKLSHPHIVQTRGIGRLPNGGYFLTMNLVLGTNLQQLLPTRMPGSRVARIVAQIAEAVTGSHAQGVIHCDLTPANVLIDEAGKAWLTDFGFARDLHSVDGTAMDEKYIAGTASYLAPEQFDMSLGQIGPTTDIHGLGAILYASLTGQPPYAKRTFEVIKSGGRAVEIDYSLLESQPSILVEICRRCLEPRPKDRFPDANSVAQALRRQTN